MHFLGNKLKQLRQSKQLTLRELANKLEVTHSYLSKVERGVINPSLKITLGLSEILGVDESYFLKKNDKLELEDLLREGVYKEKRLSEEEIKMLLGVLDVYRKSTNSRIETE